MEFCISEKEGMSKIVCDQLIKLMSCCSTKVFLNRLIMLQELADSWMNNNNKDIRFITKGKGVLASELEQLPEFIVKCNSHSLINMPGTVILLSISMLSSLLM